MKVCIIGDGLVSLTLAKMLVQKGLTVVISSSKKNNKIDKLRTIGISASNIEYFNNEILDITKISWQINQIKIYTEKNINKEILKFNDGKSKIFSIIKNHELRKLLIKDLKKNKLVKFINNFSYGNILKQNFKLIINCDLNHQITKKFFSNKIEKNYHSIAYTTVINHKKIIENNTAFQKFTNIGPIAFLPISDSQTSVVYSIRTRSKKNDFKIDDLIKKYNPVYSILKINDYNCFKLRSSHLRNYYKDNIIAFGDLLHRVHPLAGQGFNMSLRDIKFLSKLIDENINLGLDLDKSICREFEKNSKDKNYLFSTGIDYIYEFFKFESKIKSNFLSKSINVIGRNKKLNSIIRKFADYGFRV